MSKTYPRITEPRFLGKQRTLTFGLVLWETLSTNLKYSLLRPPTVDNNNFVKNTSMYFTYYIKNWSSFNVSDNFESTLKRRTELSFWQTELSFSTLEKWQLRKWKNLKTEVSFFYFTTELSFSANFEARSVLFPKNI